MIMRMRIDRKVWNVIEYMMKKWETHLEIRNGQTIIDESIYRQ